jgi:prepilin-type N-terminal cleavage/methylation domain-containing protein
MSRGTVPMRAQRQLGFSLIELMIIIAILGTLSAIAIPNIISYRENARLKAGANEMLALFRKAQVNAVKRHYNTVIDFNTAGVVTVYLDNGAGALANNSTQDAGEPTIDEYTVPVGCSLPSAKITFTGNITGFTQRGLPIGLNTGTVEVHSNSSSSNVAYEIVLSIAGRTRIDVTNL